MSIHPSNEQLSQRIVGNVNMPPRQHKIVIIRGVDFGARNFGGESLYGLDVPIAEYQNTRIYQSLDRAIPRGAAISIYWASLADNSSEVINNVMRENFPRVIDNGSFLMFHPGSFVILYGFSAGAYNALQICRRLNNFRYNYQAGRFEEDGIWTRPTADRPQILVDLLVTVDAVKNQLGQQVQQNRHWQTDVAGCVRWCVNYYQRDDDPLNGGQGPVLEGKPGKVFNVLVRNTNHRDINDATAPFVAENVRMVLNNRAPTPPPEINAQNPPPVRPNPAGAARPHTGPARPPRRGTPSFGCN